MNDFEATAWGSAVIEIVEVVKSRTAGELAIYRRWLVDPEGNEVRFMKRKKLLFRAEPRLRGSMNQMDFKIDRRSMLRVVAESRNCPVAMAA